MRHSFFQDEGGVRTSKETIWTSSSRCRDLVLVDVANTRDAVRSSAALLNRSWPGTPHHLRLSELNMTRLERLRFRSLSNASVQFNGLLGFFNLKVVDGCDYPRPLSVLFTVNANFWWVWSFGTKFRIHLTSFTFKTCTMAEILSVMIVWRVRPFRLRLCHCFGKTNLQYDYLDIFR